ncbi:hypothetical protein Scel_82290 [Streptomyces cellostaticus]|nr:hypothetical protein Scel_82290 [Streptomyces cellostaticus]
MNCSATMHILTPRVAGRTDLAGERVAGLGEVVAVGEDRGEAVDDVVPQLGCGDGLSRAARRWWPVVAGSVSTEAQPSSYRSAAGSPGGWFAQCTGEVAAGGGGDAGPQGLTGGGTQLLHDPGIAVGGGPPGGGGRRRGGDPVPR